MKKKLWISVSLIVILGVIVATLVNKSMQNTKALPISRTDIALDTVVTITVYGVDENELQKDAAAIVDTAFDMIKSYEKKFSAYEEFSEIYTLNHAEGAEIEISEETYELLEKGLHYSELSEGRFDITCGALNELWHMSDNNGFIPKQDEIDKALKTIDYRKVNIKRCENTVNNVDESSETSKMAKTSENDYKYYASLNDADIRIDLGAIAKGYIGDKVKEYMIFQGVNSAIINLGGNVVLIGGKNTGNSFLSDKNSVENFNIGIPKPFKIDEIEYTISEKDKTVVTSGNYQRYFEKDGKIYHHIMDLQTGYPAESGVSSVTIVCDTSVDADALSTICFLLGKEDGEGFLQKNIPDAKAYWVETK